MNLGVMAMKEYSIFSKALGSHIIRYSLVSYPGHLLGGGLSYPSVEMQSTYSTVTVDWAKLTYENEE